MFLVIGSFAVITVMARDGDNGHQISDYRGLAKRQPVLAMAFAVLLLGQAGIPFTTGFLAKFGVVGAAVATHAYVLAAVAMASAAVAAFFYLRVAVAMYSPVGMVGDTVGGDGDSAPDGAAADAADAGGLAGTSGTSGTPDSLASSGTPDSVASSGTSDEVSSLQILTDAPPAQSVTERGAVPVPTLTWLVIGISVAFSVVFGIIPEPILNFAHQATLLFT
jgi:NADH:ubiquinone oxidoreductase subunit 2 (subunit N)